MSLKPSSSSSHYRGYPYTNPGVIDVPTLNPDEIAIRNKWANLPKKPVTPRNPVVYIDLPAQGSSVSQSQVESNADPATHTTSRPQPQPPEKEDPQQVVYIDIPDSNSSNVSQSREEPLSTSSDVPEFVQETILYDPFKDRRISLPSSENSSQGEPSRPSPSRPTPPSTLEFAQYGAGASTPGSSGYNTNSPLSISQSIPLYPTKETSIYGNSNDGFPLSPIPVSEFPRPPPSYEEVESRPNPSPILRPTEVIVTPSANAPIIGLPDLNRKFVKCQHCAVNVHTMMLLQNGPLTHYVAIVFAFLFLPLLFLLYCTPCCNFFKYRNHYCPNCNKKIGHEIPALCQGMVYVDANPY